MSYATSLLMAYPPPYGPSTLLSDDLVYRSSLGHYYEPSTSYRSERNHLLSDEFTLGPNPISYRRPSYSNYRTPLITDWQRDIPAQTSYTSLNNVREYSESLNTTSNTNTASSMARSIDENNYNNSTNRFSNYQQNYNRLLNDVNRSPVLTTIWSTTGPKIPASDDNPTPTFRGLQEPSPTFRAPLEPASTFRAPQETTPTFRAPLEPASTFRAPQQTTPTFRAPLEPAPTFRAPPEPAPTFRASQEPAPTFRAPPESSPTVKQTPIEERNDDRTPIPPVQENNPPPTEPESQQQPSSVNIHAWLSENKTEPTKEEKPAEEAWTARIDQLHTIQAQREKEKIKAARSLPNIKNKIDTTPRITSFQRQSQSYFDSLFDGNYFRKNSTNQQNYSLSYQRKRSTSNSFNKPKTTIFPKYLSPRKPPGGYEPPAFNRGPPSNPSGQQTIKQNSNISISPRENIYKNPDERFREALNKVRLDRAEQQQKEINESTAKRLNYGNYVRNSSKDTLLQNAIKPAPWSDFLDMKKGHAYTLTKEEKKDLYNQSRSYGERIRNRNFALHHGDETVRSQPRLLPFPIENQELESGDETSHQQFNEDENESKSLKNSTSPSTIKTTNKTYAKYANANHSSRTTDQSRSTSRPSEQDDGDTSDYESNHKQKKKYYQSSGRTTTVTDESSNDETSEQRSIPTKYRDTDEDLFTVREEKTMESLENARYKKR